MTETCTRAVRSMRTLAQINLAQARTARRAGWSKARRYHLTEVATFRRLAQELKATAIQ